MSNAVAEKEPLYQVWATEVRTNKLVAVPFFPRVAKTGAEKFAGTMREQIAKGNEKRYADPQALLHINRS